MKNYDPFTSHFQKLVWKTKYAAPQDKNSVTEFWSRIATAVASIEKEEDQHFWMSKYYNILFDFGFSFGGRVMANAGRDDVKTTLINCFGAQGALIKDLDSLDGILKDVWLVTKTLQSEGGWGGNFSYMRPRGTVIEGTGTQTPGVVRFMELFDKASEIVTADVMTTAFQGKRKKVASRKGAMMGVLDVWHPDIEEFITAKQVANRLTKFNLSVGITDGFMEAVKKDADWHLEFPKMSVPEYREAWDGDLEAWKKMSLPVVKHKTIKAKYLWDLIMSSTYNRNEPGVLFIDNMNKTNNLYTLGYSIRATNPCVRGDTLVAVADGRNAVRIDQLAMENRDVIVYSRNKSGLVEIKKAYNFRKTGENEKILKIVLDDNSFINVTENHNFLLRNNTFKKAKDLKIGDSLMPFKSYNCNGYRQISESSKRIKKNGFRYSRRQYRLIWGYFNGEINGKDMRLHHSDYCKTNDALSNLILCTREEHLKYHDITGKNNPMYKLKNKNKYHKNMSIAVSGLKNGRAYNITNEDYVEKIINIIVNIGKENLPFYKNRKIYLGRQHFFSLLKKYDLPLPTSKFRLNFLNCNNFCDFRNKILDLAFNNNHKVKNIIKNGFSDVYNCTVDDNHNYGIITNSDDYINCINSTGIFIRNCGEIPTASKIMMKGDDIIGGDVCNLGSINLTRFVINDKKENIFDWTKFIRYVQLAVRALDSVLDIAKYPLGMYKNTALSRRKVGLGFMGLGSTFIMMGIRYGSESSIQFVERLMHTLVNASYQSSALLAREKGPFPLWDKKMLESGFFKYAIDNNILDDNTVKLIKKYGLRNAALNAIAPNGHTSIYCGVVSGGHEPVFAPQYYRWYIVEDKRGFPYKDDLPNVLVGEWFETDNFKFDKDGDEEVLLSVCGNYKIDKNRGLIKREEVLDYGYKYQLNNGLDKTETPKFLIGANDLNVADHLAIHNTVSKFIDQSVSKTVNLPHDYPFTDFRDLYLNVWESGGKGITTYRQGTMTMVLDNGTSKKVDKISEQKSELEKLFERAGENVIPRNVKLPTEAYAKQIILKAENRKWHVTMVFADKLMMKPFAVFIKTNNNAPSSITEKVTSDLIELAREEGVYPEDIELFKQKLEKQNNLDKIARSIGFTFRHNISMVKIVDVLEKQQVCVTSVIYQLKKLLATYIKDGTIIGVNCEHCGGEMIFQNGCKICRDCGSGQC